MPHGDRGGMDIFHDELLVRTELVITLAKQV